MIPIFWIQGPRPSYHSVVARGIRGFVFRMTTIFDLTSKSPRSLARAAHLTPSDANARGHRELRAALFGDGSTELSPPAAQDLAAALERLATGSADKALLPLDHEPREVALLRRGDFILVSEYGADATPDVRVWNRRVSFDALREACVDALDARAGDASGPSAAISRELGRRLAALTPVPDASSRMPERREGGQVKAPAKGTPLAFGFHADFWPNPAAAKVRSTRADIHALLFPGTLWAYIRGRRVELARGPILLAVQRLLAALRCLLDAWNDGRPAHVRLRSGAFSVSVRLRDDRRVGITLGSAQGESVTAEGLELAAVAKPILRVASALSRAALAVDRSQSRNLRMRAFRDDIRDLRRAFKDREAVGFAPEDPQRVRDMAGLSNAALDLAFGNGDSETRKGAFASEPAVNTDPRARALRYGERWRIAVDGLDADGTFLCGDRIVVATSRHTIAIGRDDGDLLWLRSGFDLRSFMAGTTLVRLEDSGHLELCDVADGEPFATGNIAAQRGGTLRRITVGGGGLPPTLVIADAEDRVIALDLRTAQPRWQLSLRRATHTHFVRVGRVLIIASPEGNIHAVDAASGEELWCYAARERCHGEPVVVGDRLFVATGARGARRSTLHLIDLPSGRAIARRVLDGALLSSPLAVDRRLAIAVELEGESTLMGLSPADLSTAWQRSDPGLGAGAAAISVDDALILNRPGATIACVDARSGETRWTHRAGEPSDDVPRRLEPILRGGALFVPSSTVQILRPADGRALGDGLRCDLVPDWLRVDERGWVYVAEESGHLYAHAPVPHLTLIRGG